MTGSNSAPVLVDIAKEINEHDQARLACQVKGVMHGLKVGELLLEAKKIVPHGQFSIWREEHTTVSQRMAQMYMTIARDPRITESFIREYETVSPLTLQKAVQLTREPRKKTPQEHAAAINEFWKTITREWASWLGDVRAAFPELGGDAQFAEWMVEADLFPRDVALRLIPPTGEPFDADRLGEALIEHVCDRVLGEQAIVEERASSNGGTFDQASNLPPRVRGNANVKRKGEQHEHN